MEVTVNCTTAFRLTNLMVAISPKLEDSLQVDRGTECHWVIFGYQLNDKKQNDVKF